MYVTHKDAELMEKTVTFSNDVILTEATSAEKYLNEYHNTAFCF